jgi:precorrin-3B synthase
LAPPFLPHPGPVAEGYLVAFEFGQVDADTLALLGETGPIRLTPWRMVLVETQGTLPDAAALLTRTDDPRLRVTACTGMPGCLQAQAPVRDLARALAPMFRRAAISMSRAVPRMRASPACRHRPLCR